MKKRIYLLILGLAATVATLDAQSRADKKALSTEYFYDAIEAQVRGDYYESWYLLEYVYSLNPDDAEICYELGSFYLTGKTTADQTDYSYGFSLIKKASELAPENKKYALAYVQILIYQDEWDAAKSLINKQISLSPEDKSLKETLARIYQKEGKVQEALNVYASLLKGDENNLSDYLRYTTERLKIYRTINDIEGQIRETKKLATKFPTDIQYQILWIDLLLSKKEHHKEALSNIKQWQKSKDTKKWADLFLINYWRHVGDLAKAKTALTKALINLDDKDEQLLAYAFYQLDELFKAYQEDKATQKSLLAHYDRLRQLMNRDAAVDLDIARRWVAVGDTTRAITLAKEAIRMDDTNEAVWQDALDLLSMWGAKETPALSIEAGKKLKKASFYVFAAIWYISNEEYPKAKELLDTAEKLAGSNSYELSGIFFYQGALAQDLNDSALAEGYYKRSLEINPDNHMTLNNYAYLLATEERELEKAEGMASRAININPSSNNLDTYAYILLLEKKYHLARIYQDKAIDKAKEEGDESPVFYLHMGDIYSALQEYESAYESYKNAERLARKTADEANLKEVLAKKQAIEKKLGSKE